MSEKDKYYEDKYYGNPTHVGGWKYPVKTYSQGFQAGLKQGAELAAAEEELDGPMPDELKHTPVEDIARAAVRTTKRNIEQAILKVLDE